jgi:hypothetical protein
MPHITFPVDANGLSLSLMFGLNGNALAQLAAAGKPLPAPVLVRGVIDTGSDVTCLAAPIVQQLRLPVLTQRTTQTVAGPLQVNIYEASLGIPDPGHSSRHLLVLDQLIIMELVQPPSPGIDALLGLDVVLQLLLFLDGPRREFTLGD